MFATRAAEKLREQGSLAGQLLVFAHTSPFRPGPSFARSMVIPLRRPTADTRELVNAAIAGIRRIYQPGYQLSKAGVMLLDLQASTVMQGELDLEDDVAPDKTRLMQAMDAINGRYGKGTLQVGSIGASDQPRDWAMKQERRTPRYTTRWDEMALVRA